MNPRGPGIWICRRIRCCGSGRVLSAEASNAKRLSSSLRKPKLPESPARTRFAPSPTGNLHLGSIRTALFSYLLAKRTNGKFLLRVEDTDQKRTVPNAEQRLYDDLRWAGLHWDEGPIVGGPHGPYKQSERLPIYHAHIQELLQAGKAYRCFCSAERIDGLNRLRHKKGLPLGYDRQCATLPNSTAEERVHKGEGHVIRFRIPSAYPKFNDLVYGKTGHGTDKTKKMQYEEPVYDDPVLIKSDGYPTYHFANVVDDRLMEITHVLRGSEWMASTPLHVALYEAFGWAPPIFGHVPLLVDHNRQKLSKRNLDMDIASYKRAGYFSDALVNFSALLGWSHQQKSDVMDLKQLERVFDLKFTKGNTIVAFDKLVFLQEQHARRKVNTGGEMFEQMIRDVAMVLLERYGALKITQFIGKRKLRDVIGSMLHAEALPFRSPSDFVDRAAIFVDADVEQPPLDIQDVTLLKPLRVAATTLCLVPAEEWTKKIHRTNLAALSLTSNIGGEDSDKKQKKALYHYLRWALLHGKAGPSIPETLEILGREICIARIKRAVLLTQEIEAALTKPDLAQGRSLHVQGG